MTYVISSFLSFMSYLAYMKLSYDICRSYCMSILVSKEALGPQECSPTSQNVSTIVLWVKHGKYIHLTFPLYFLGFPLYILYKKLVSRGKRILMKNGKSFGANTNLNLDVFCPPLVPIHRKNTLLTYRSINWNEHFS